LNRQFDTKVELFIRVQSSSEQLIEQVKTKKALLKERIEKAKLKSKLEKKIQDEIMK